MNTATTLTPYVDSPTVLDLLIDGLQEARVSLTNARAAHDHSPNADTSIWLEQVRVRLDALLDAYLDTEAGR